MSYSHPMSSEEPGSDHSSLPGVHVTVDQVVAMNIRYWRKKAKLTQEQLAELVGWSGANISAAELSANEGKDKRRFDAHTLITFAIALDVPLAALFLPPEDDGISRRYLFHADPGECRPMSDLVTLAISEPADDVGPAMDAYRVRYYGAVSRYADPRRGEQLAARMKGITTAEERKARLERLAWQREALAATVGDVDQLMDAIADMESES